MKPLKQVEAEKITKGTFTIQDTPIEHIAGYSRKHDDWNGWQKPYFEKAEADKIADIMDEIGLMGGSLKYDAKTDTYCYACSDDNGESSYYKGEDILTTKGMKHVYQLGGCYWIWDRD